MKINFFVFICMMFCSFALGAEERPAMISRKEPSTPAKVRVTTPNGEETKEESAPPRLKVQPPDEDEESVKDLIGRIQDSMERNNLKAYASCFTKEFMNKNKAKAAVMFLEDDLSLDVEKFQIIDSDEDQIEFVVKYTTSFGENEFDTVSNIFAKRENEGLVISKEKVISEKINKQSEGFGGQVVFRPKGDPAFPEMLDGEGDAVQDCPNGRCKFAPKNPKPEKKPKKEFSLFNDANGKPDPNGPMWLPIETLMEAYPEDYKNCECMKGR